MNKNFKTFIDGLDEDQTLYLLNQLRYLIGVEGFRAKREKREQSNVEHARQIRKEEQSNGQER